MLEIISLAQPMSRNADACIARTLHGGYTAAAADPPSLGPALPTSPSSTHHEGGLKLVYVLKALHAITEYPRGLPSM